ncbi:phosphatase PAP2 family protein [Methanobacterium sp. MBAC-LM]|uniref:phosphatase PAP2 family protein n=1 Tax=Methanobacterium sp. MBAC-LM TaxID=3412034 RepID=UPI003C7844F3
MHNILLNGILNYNIALFYSINNGMYNPVFNIIMPILTNFGSLIACSLVCVLIFIFGGRYSKKVAILGLLALFLSSAAVLTLKYIVAEPRPFAVLNNVHLLAIENDYSFPSGHAAASFAAAVAIGEKYSFIIKSKSYKLVYPLLAFAAVIGFSRVYIGVHYPLDVIFGAVIGTISALAVVRFEGKILDFIYLKRITNMNIAKKLKDII